MINMLLFLYIIIYALLGATEYCIECDVNELFIVYQIIIITIIVLAQVVGVKY